MPIAIAIVKSFNIPIFLFLKADDDDAMTMKMKGRMGRRPATYGRLCNG